jgi:endothelin-converting enzyme
MDEEDHELVFVGSEKKKRTRAKRALNFLGLVAVCGLVIAVVALAIALGVVIAREDQECPLLTCKTSGCTKLAQTVQENLDTSVDPCVDFYNFSCGGWVKNNPLPEGRARYSPFSKLDEENKKQLITILNSSKDDDIEAVAKLKKLYRLCLNESHLNESGAAPMLTVIRYFGGWPLLNSGGSGSGSGHSSGSGSGTIPFLSSDNFLVMKIDDNPALFSFYVSVDDKNSSRYTIFLTQSGLTLPSPENYANDSETLLNAFHEYAMDTLHLLNSDVPRDNYEEAVHGIIELEKKLAKIFVSAVDLRDPVATYNNMTIEQLSSMFPNTLDWTHVFKRSFSLVDNEVTTNEEVVVRTTSYFQNLSKVLARTHNDTMLNYVMWHLVNRYIPFLSQDFLQVYHKFTQTVYGSGERDRNETCLAIVQRAMPIALARPYTEFVLPGGTKEAVSDMISKVKQAFKERVNDSDWLEDSTKVKCDKKVDAITQKVAYPQLIYHDSYVNRLYNNYSVNYGDLLVDMVSIVFEIGAQNLRRLHTNVDKTEWDIAPTAVNAYYNPSFNQFTFLEGILAPPFFRADWPDYFTYGALGVVVGHELTHGFDDQGQQYDKDGNLKMWWDPTSIKRFKDRQTCFRNQYSAYELYGLHVNGNLTLGENLADNGGLKTSYQAYKTVSGIDAQFHLPDLKYTPDQLFFIAFAQVWCSSFTKEYIATSLLTNPHSPGPFRVKGTLMNSQEFADAFHCSKGSPMNPVDKCLMW